MNGQRKTPVIITKRKLKTMRGHISRTNGKDKGPHCMATGIHRIICSRNRSYKRKDYEQQFLKLLHKN